ATISAVHACDASYSEPYLSASQRLLVPTSSSARDLADLQGQPICATEGSTSASNLEALSATVKTVPTRIDCLVALQEGKVAAISTDDAILAGFVAQDPETKIIGPSLEGEPYGVVVPKTDPELARFVNGVLEQMRRDGAWQRSFNTWLAKYHAIPDRQPPPTNGST